MPHLNLDHVFHCRQVAAIVRRRFRINLGQFIHDFEVFGGSCHSEPRCCTRICVEWWSPSKSLLHVSNLCLRFCSWNSGIKGFRKMSFGQNNPELIKSVVDLLVHEESHRCILVRASTGEDLHKYELPSGTFLLSVLWPLQQLVGDFQGFHSCFVGVPSVREISWVDDCRWHAKSDPLVGDVLTWE